MTQVETLMGRYELGEALGAGGFGATRLAVDLRTGDEVVLKELDVRRAGDWKSVELFEREASVLAELEHPAIPEYIDAFDLEEDGATRFFLVQQRAPGRTLEELANGGGWRPTREEVLTLGEALLEVCAYLHELNPPVVHRDIKPGNVMRAEDGLVSLVDFGSVKARWEERSGGSTVVGTLGYMAPEQLRGAADGRSDLYGLGSTLIYVLTRREPEDLPTRGLRTDTAELFPNDPTLARWLEGLIEPDPDARFESARAALAALAVLDEVRAEDAPSPSPDDASDSEPVILPPRPRPGTIEHTHSVTRDSVGLAVGAAVVMVVATIFFMTGPVGWAAAFLGPMALLVCWAMMYAGLGPKNTLETPDSKRLESSGSMMASGLMATLLSLCVGFSYESTGLTGPGVVALVGLSPLLLLSWVMVVMEWETWSKWTHRKIYENEMGAELTADISENDSLEVSKTRRGLELGVRAGLAPWAFVSLGLVSNVVGLGLEIGRGSLLFLSQKHLFPPIAGGALITLGVLIALSRWAWFSDELVLEDDVVKVRFGGRTRAAHPSEIERWETTVRVEEDTSSDPDDATEEKFVVVLALHLSGGLAPMIYEESADSLAGARRKRVLLDALLRKRLAGAPVYALEGEGDAVVFDWEGTWSEEETITHEVAAESW